MSAARAPEISNERIENLIAELWVLPVGRKVVRVNRDEVLSLIREVKRHRSGQNPWDRQRAEERRSKTLMGINP